MNETDIQPAPASPDPAHPETEICVRPALAWFGEVETLIASLSVQRLELRRTLGIEEEQLRALRPRGGERLSNRDARELAKSEVLGAEWRRAYGRVHHARQRVISARRQLQALASEARSRRERSAGWAYVLFHAPRHAWKARPLKKRLRQANAHRHEALRTIHAVRPQLLLPEVRSRIFRLTETFLLKEERLTHSVQSRKEIDQKITATLSSALCLAPRLRDLGIELVPMQRPTNPELCLATVPVPVGPLCAPKPAQQRGQKIHVH